MQTRRVSTAGFKLIFAFLAVATCAAAHAKTYWLGAGSNATPPGCFKFYENEDLTGEVVVTPTADDGNTYVVLGSGAWKGAYTAPAGTTWVFGKDGQTVGTSKARPKFNANGWMTVNFGNCTIYGINVTVAYNNLLGWGGVNTLVNCGQEFVFKATAIQENGQRGVDFKGKFIAETDVTMQIKGADWRYSGAKAYYTVTGDFSDYKGKFSVEKDSVPTTFSLASATAFGKSTVTMDDYLTVKNGVTLSIAPAVVQYATKGITFSLGADETAYIDVESGKDLTLIAPIGGSTGTLAKTGVGTLTLATSVEMTNLSVDAGTLIVDSTASFAANTTLKVKNGATVVSRVGSNIPNVTLDLSEGGAFSYDFTVPFNGTSVTTMDYTSLTAADRALLTKPIAITLSQKITLPQNTAMNLAVARFSASAGFEAADFTDGTAKTYGLPNTTFAMSEPDNGIVTLTMAVKPVITRTGGDKYAPLDARYTYATTTDGIPDYTLTPVWSDGEPAHSGADYVHANGDWSVITISSYYGWHNGEQTFAGDSLYLTSPLYMKSAKLVLPKTTFVGDGQLYDSSGSPRTHTYAGGPYIFPNGLRFTGVMDGTTPIRYALEATCAGAGTLTLTCAGLDTTPSSVTGDNSELKGKVVVTHQGTPSDVSESARLEVGLGSSLGGAMDAFTADGITIKKYSIVRPQQTMALNAANRGVTIDGYGGFDVGEGKVLTIANPVALTGESGSLIKMGAGSLKLDGAVTRSGANTIAVDEGWLTAPADDVANDADVVFAAGTGLEIDLTAVSENGLKLTRANALSFADSRLKVRFSNAAAAEEAHTQFSVAICTVPTGSSLTADSFAYVRSCKGYDVTIRKETLDGYDRFVADCVPKGIMLIVL